MPLGAGFHRGPHPRHATCRSWPRPATRRSRGLSRTPERRRERGALLGAGCDTPDAQVEDRRRGTSGTARRVGTCSASAPASPVARRARMPNPRKHDRADMLHGALRLEESGLLRWAHHRDSHDAMVSGGRRRRSRRCSRRSSGPRARRHVGDHCARERKPGTAQKSITSRSTYRCSHEHVSAPVN